MKLQTRAVFAALFFILSFGCARADFPSGTVTIVVPYSASGATDVLARNLAKVWSEHWKKPVVVINRTGADGMIGSQ